MKWLSSSFDCAKLETWTIGSLRQNPYLKKFYYIWIQSTLRANRHSKAGSSTHEPVSTKCILQTADWVQNADWELFFRLIFSIWFATLLESGKSIDSSCAIANIFNNFFVNEGRNADKRISKGNCYPFSFLNGNFPESMFLSPITSLEVEYYISQMDNNKFIGPCSIPVPLLKILKTQISPLLSFLNNDSFLWGIFPNKLKLAKLLQFSRKTRQR